MYRWWWLVPIVVMNVFHVNCLCDKEQGMDSDKAAGDTCDMKSESIYTEEGSKTYLQTQNTLQGYMDSLLQKAEVAEPIERYLYKMLEYYTESRIETFGTFSIVGSTGNKLYIPEQNPDRSFQFEVDILLENPIIGMKIPVLGSEPIVASFVVDNLDNSLPLGSVVLRLEKYEGEFESDFVKNQWFQALDKGKAVLSSFHYWGSMISATKSILGERELIAHPAPLLQPLFRKFKTEKKKLILEGKTYEFAILMDKVASVRIPWPREAGDFGSRKRTWPESSVIEKVIKDGCLLVHNPHNRDGTYFLEWKYTFSTSEQEIVRNFSPSQRSLFLVIKQIKRQYLDYGTSEIGEPLSGITTYHLKTIMLWLSEKLDPTSWETSPLDCFVMFFKDFEKCLDTEICPHYFIPEINVMKSAWEPKMLQQYESDWLKENGPMRDKLLVTVRDIIHHPHVYLTDALLTVVDDKHVMESQKDPVKKLDQDYYDLDILDQALVLLNERRAVKELNTADVAEDSGYSEYYQNILSKLSDMRSDDDN